MTAYAFSLDASLPSKRRGVPLLQTRIERKSVNENKFAASVHQFYDLHIGTWLSESKAGDGKGRPKIEIIEEQSD